MFPTSKRVARTGEPDSDRPRRPSSGCEHPAGSRSRDDRINSRRRHGRDAEPVDSSTGAEAAVVRRFSLRLHALRSCTERHGAVAERATGPVLRQDELRAPPFHRQGDAKPLKIAPPFRILHTRYPIESIAEALAEGISTGHPSMPSSSSIPTRSTICSRSCGRCNEPLEYDGQPDSARRAPVPEADLLKRVDERFRGIRAIRPRRISPRRSAPTPTRPGSTRSTQALPFRSTCTCRSASSCAITAAATRPSPTAATGSPTTRSS